MQIKLINCDVNLKGNFGIDMQAIGSFDQLCTQLSAKLPFLNVEYDYPPLDYILIEVQDGIIVPDLSMFGEVQPYGNPLG